MPPTRNERLAVGGSGGSGNVTADWSPQGFQVTDQSVRYVWAEITDGTNPYAWFQVDETDAPGFPGFATTDVTLKGSATVGDWPAYEISGNANVAAGTKVQLWPAPSLDHWLFVAPADETTAAGDCPGGCGTLVGLADDACLSLEVVCATGSFSAMSTTQVTDAAAQLRNTAAGTWTLQEWVDGSPGSWQDFNFDWTGGTGTVVLTFEADGTPVLNLGGNPLYLRCAAADATFVGGPRNGFTGGGSPPTEACAPNDFVLRVACTCCSIDGWEGPDVTGVTKWYCVDTGDGCPGEAMPLTVEDRCDDTIVICSGPYDTQEEAEADCPPPTPVTISGCPDHPVSRTLRLEFTAASGDCSCLLGETVDLNYNGTAWVGTFNPCGSSPTTTVTATYDPGFGTFGAFVCSMSGAFTHGDVFFFIDSCDPFVILGQNFGSWNSGCTSAADGTLSETV